MKLNTGDLIVIENTNKLSEFISQFYKKWATSNEAAMAMMTGMATAPVTAKEKQTGKKVELKYRGSGWKQFENKRLIGIVTEIMEEEHPDFDVIKIREQTGGVRYCRRYILEKLSN